MMQERTDEKTMMVRGRHRMLLVIWVAILWSITIFIAMPIIVGVKPMPVGNNTAFAVFAALCLLLALSSFILKGILLSRAVSGQNIALAASGYILAFALCEASCLVALLACFTGVSPYYYLLFIPGILCVLLNMPRRDRLLSTIYKGEA